MRHLPKFDSEDHEEFLLDFEKESKGVQISFFDQIEKWFVSEPTLTEVFHDNEFIKQKKKEIVASVYAMLVKQTWGKVH